MGAAFFGYDNDKDLKVCFLVMRVKCPICSTGRHELDLPLIVWQIICQPGNTQC